MEHFLIDLAYCEGRSNRILGFPADSNPHPKFTMKWLSFDTGWHSALTLIK